MVITRKVLNQLTSALAIVAISAGETELEKAIQYAQITSASILNEWAEKNKDSWEVEEE